MAFTDAIIEPTITSADLIQAVQDGLTAQGYTVAKAAYLVAVADANIVQVHGQIINGDGSEINPWGP